MTDTQFFPAHTSRRVRSIFNRRAPHFHQADFLVAEIANRLLDKLEVIKLTPQRIVDAGCATGNTSLKLQQRYPQSQIVALDSAWRMVAAARQIVQPKLSLLQRWRKPHPAPLLMCADMTQLPLSYQSVDMIFSNLAAHWIADPDALIKNWAAHCQIGGLLVMSCFGPDTLKELRAAYASLGRETRINPFVDMHDWGDLLVAGGFASPVMDMEKVVITYQDPQRLLADVRLLGAATLPDLHSGLKGRTYQQRLLNALENQRRADGTLSLTFEIIYGHAWKVAPRRTASGEAIVRFEKLATTRDQKP